MTQPNTVHLTWTLEAATDGSHVVVEYQLTNRFSKDIFVADTLIAYHEGKIKLVPDRVVVTAGKAPNSIRLIRALVRTNTTRMDHPPGARRLEPGATHTGHARLPLPIRGWHNYGTPPGLPKQPKTAVLEIAYLVGESIQWGQVTTTDGTAVIIPQMQSYMQFAKLAVSTSKPLP